MALNPKFTSPFTRNLYELIQEEINRIEDTGSTWTNKQRERHEAMTGWIAALEGDSQFVTMQIAKFPPDGPLRL